MCDQTPLAYTSNNAPTDRDVLGTLILSVLMGQKRYAHINALRNDSVSPELFGISKVVSEDSVRRAFKRGTEEQWNEWLRKQERADGENVFDEIKNQWGWGGYMTQDLKRCRIMARLIAIVYNGWNIFARLARPDQHMEAITSRPFLLNAVGRLVKTGRKRILHLTSTHAQADQIRLILNRISRFFNDLSRTAEQLSAEGRWAVILSAAFIKWLRGKILHPVTEGDQILLQLDI